MIFTIFAYTIFNIDVESNRIVTKMQTMNRITKRDLKDENFGQNLANFEKKCNFLQNVIYQKLHFAL